ncbi:DNA polymerase III subunit delta' [uncultured Limosilactobacillus sp.]|uniref:DNA polymerase III subunit delta' n=1 Tax=uncultured Limosilactobacillus sp. TaxID=2837629 RepID=UPI0025DC6FD6|nr:DNA polymerase III subunit delta' [uncultured Limosilactobacillus sp.]
MSTKPLTAKELQPAIVERFQRIISNGELAHAYLFVGPNGSGKQELAQWLSLSIFCTHPHFGQPDLSCSECQRVLSGNHPDIVRASAEGRQIKVDQIRHLKAEFTKSGMEGQKKVFIIEDADKMTTNAANSLLKFIEEPGAGSYIFLLTNNKNAVLPTIQSRTQIVELQPLSKTIIKQMLDDYEIPEYLRPVILGLTDSATQAAQWVADDWLAKTIDTIVHWFQELTQVDPIAFVDVQTVMKGLASDREKQLIFLDLMALIWRDALVTKLGPTKGERLYFQQWQQIVEKGVRRYSMHQLVKVSQITLEAHQLLGQNISFQNVAEQQTLRILKLLHG